MDISIESISIHLASEESLARTIQGLMFFISLSLNISNLCLMWAGLYNTGQGSLNIS